MLHGRKMSGGRQRKSGARAPRYNVNYLTVCYFLYSIAAPTKPLNSGCGWFGRDLNSGWA